jgi:hypothetical protein
VTSECASTQGVILLSIRVLLRLELRSAPDDRCRVKGRHRGCGGGDPLRRDSAQLTVQVASNLEPGDELRAFAESCGGVVRQVG